MERQVCGNSLFRPIAERSHATFLQDFATRRNSTYEYYTYRDESAGMMYSSGAGLGVGRSTKTAGIGLRAVMGLMIRPFRRTLNAQEPVIRLLMMILGRSLFVLTGLSYRSTCKLAINAVEGYFMIILSRSLFGLTGKIKSVFWIQVLTLNYDNHLVICLSKISQC